MFRSMTDDDLDDMAAMLGNPEIMTFYPRPKSVEEAQAWINWNKANYAEHRYGLWIIETSHPTPTSRPAALASRKRHNRNDTVSTIRGQGPSAGYPVMSCAWCDSMHAR